MSIGVIAAGQLASAQTVTPATFPADVQRSIDRLRERAFESDLAYEIVEGLTAEVGPRLAGSEAEARARAWAVAMLRTQRFQNVRVEPFTIPYWARTYDSAVIISPAPQPLVIAALGGSAPTPPGGLEGDVVRFTSMAELAAADPDRVRGRIAFIDEGFTRTQDGLGYSMAVRRRGCAPVAQAKGAIACVIRSVGTHSHRFPHQGGSARQPEGVSLPAAALSPPDADQLTRLLQRGPVRLRLDIDVEVADDAPSGNVIAEIVGRERPNEIVLIGAHLDSWDQGTGALDDGAGVAIVVAAARLIRDLPRRPRRTIRVVLYGAEETGLHGAAAYARQHADELARHVAAGESDFGADRIYRLRTRFGDGALPYVTALQQALAPLGIAPGDNLANGGPDMGPLRQVGVPILELGQNGWDYFNFHHTPDDTLDKIDPAALRQNVAAYAIAAYLIADMDWDVRATSP
ncbi:MAG: M20/M25/M40 family metallo-hydrolase [Terricaulis sp.]